MKHLGSNAAIDIHSLCMSMNAATPPRYFLLPVLKLRRGRSGTEWAEPAEGLNIGTYKGFLWETDRQMQFREYCRAIRALIRYYRHYNLFSWKDTTYRHVPFLGQRRFLGMSGLVRPTKGGRYVGWLMTDQMKPWDVDGRRNFSTKFKRWLLKKKLDGYSGVIRVVLA
jgi:hypothetical protein